MRSPSHPEKEDHPHSAAVSPTSPETKTQDDNVTGIAESLLEPGATITRLSSDMPRLPCFVSCLEQDNRQDMFDRDSEDKENLSGCTSSGNLDNYLGITTENCASPRSKKRKHSDDNSDCSSTVIYNSDDNSASNTGMFNTLQASLLPVKKQVLQENNTLPTENMCGLGNVDSRDNVLCGHKVNLLTQFGYRRPSSRLRFEERPSATLDSSRLNDDNTAESKIVFESDSGYLSDEEESTDSDETASHLSSGCVSLTRSDSHPVHIDLSQDTEDTKCLQQSFSGTLQEGNSAGTKVIWQ